MGEILSQISDVLTAKWPEILAILTSTGAACFIFKFLCSWLITIIQNKTKEKFSKPILEELQQVKKAQENLKEEMAQLLIEHNNESDNRIKKAFEEEAERKALAYAEVLNEELPVEEEVTITEVVEPVIEEPVVEPVVEEQPEEQKIIAKRVIVND